MAVVAMLRSCWTSSISGSSEVDRCCRVTPQLRDSERRLVCTRPRRDDHQQYIICFEQNGAAH